MEEYSTEDVLNLLDGKNIPSPGDSGDTTQPSADTAQTVKDDAAQEAKKDDQKVKKKRKPRKPKKDGVFALPVYKAAYDSYKECVFRFRKVNGNGKAIAREVTANLKRIMVDIELVYWQIKPKSILPETFALVLETIVVIRAMKDFGDLSTKDFAIISQYTAKLSKNMRAWSEAYNNGN